MLPAIDFPHRFISFGLLQIIIFFLLAPSPSYSKGLELQSLSMRARISEKTLLGEEAPEDFEAYDLSANFGLPWQRYSATGWGTRVRHFQPDFGQKSAPVL
ncbi:hypothetical protein [Halomonas daqiaonensis]|uniref:Uncharacterized protein n=1 Tax=Halomonas daqiaonensis TaxID=650850 RepID=A0A1H7WER7_9GAMM|nr:hypothetical protein [Halomonas daqiaonensis]SEM20082.1 hypothetical protein SAMN04488129_13217 [Halomonas daqiaonensis]